MTDMDHAWTQLAFGLSVAFVGALLWLACRAWDVNQWIRRKP